MTEALGCENTEADELFCSLQQLVKNCLYEGLADRQSVAAIFPGKYKVPQVSCLLKYFSGDHC